MEHKNILSVLICVLLISSGIVLYIVMSLRREIYYIPEKSIDDIVSILEDSDIFIDKELIPKKKKRSEVYVCASRDYNSTVAKLLGMSDIKYSFAVPDGELLIMTDGARFEFGDNYSFRYCKDGKNHGKDAPPEFSDIAEHLSDEKKREIEEAVSEFLDRGNGEFANSAKMSIVTSITRVWQNAGKYYALCSRQIDGTEIKGNVVLCTVEDGQITDASGTWCFLTLGKSYSAQLTDILNILFNVKKELSGTGTQAQLREGGIRILSVGICYSLYMYGETEDFCLIPCWQIVTDKAGEFIYNGVDSTLYTKK